MSPRPSTMRGPARSLAAAILAAAALAPTASAATEIVSRVGGEGSLPFAAQLGPSSADGRFVVLKLGTPNDRAPVPGPEAEVASPSGYVLRDRVAQTITPLTLQTDTGTLLPGTISQISDDGKRLLLFAEGATPVVLDRPSGKALALPTVPGIVVGAQLSADGTQAIVSTTGADAMNNPAKDNAIYRGPLGGAGTQVLKLHGIRLARASADLQTLLYSRELPRVVQPGHPEATFTGTAIGLKQGSDAPHVIAQSSFHQTRRSTETCSEDYMGIRTVRRDVSPVSLSADGGRAAWSVSGSDSDFQGLTSFGYRVRKAAGDIASVDKMAYYSPNFEALGRTHDVSLIPQVAFKDSPTLYRRAFVNDDKSVLVSDVGSGNGPGPQPTRYVTAEDFDPGTTTAPSSLTFTSAEPVDSATLQPDVVWASCDGAPAPPVAAAKQYVSFTKANPLRSSASMGYLFFIPDWAGYRDAASATAEVKIFGITVWKKALAPTTIVNLPRPWPYIPTTIKVTVQGKSANGVKPPPVSTQYAVYATR